MEKTAVSGHDLLSAYDVVKLLERKSLLKCRLRVSIKGMITSLSRIVRLKSDLFFMMELDSCIPVLIKDFKLDWHTLLEPGGTYLFYNLIVTTVEKGISQPFVVVSAWEDSHLAEVTQDRDVKTVSLKHWLETRNMVDDLPDFGNDVGDCSHAHCTDNLVNYEGRVTSTQDAKDGFFTLDEKIRLLCCDVDLPVNCKIYIYNAHLIKLDSTIYLTCCVKTLVRRKCTESACDRRDFDKLNEAQQAKGLKSLFEKGRLTLREILAAINLRDSLLTVKSNLDHAARTVKRLLCEKSLWQVPKKSRSPLDTFFRHDVLCPHANNNRNASKVPVVLSLAAVKHEQSAALPHRDADIDKDNKFYSTCRFFNKNENQVLAGIITIGSSGQLFFSNASENLPLLILANDVKRTINEDTCYDDNSDAVQDHDFTHYCTNKCVNDVHFGAYLPCSVLDSSIIGKLIFIREFYILTEGNQSSDEKSELMYLAIHLQSCVLVDKRESSTSRLSDAPTLTRRRSRSSSCIDEKRTCHLYVTNKLQLQSTFSAETLEFTALGFVLERKHSENAEVDPPKTQRLFRENVASNCVTQEARNNSLTMREDDKKENLPHISCRLDQSKPVSVVFSGALSNWYHHITAGCLYLLETAQNSLLPSFINRGLWKAVEHCKARQEIRVPEDVKVQRVMMSIPITEETPSEMQLCSVGDIMSDRLSEGLVSFQGQIERRCISRSIFTDDRSKHLSTFSMTDMCVHVRQLPCEQATKSVAILVYVSAPKSIYNFGLVPGAVIHFTCVEKRVSQKGNVYCRFTSASSLKVLTLLPLDETLRPNVTEGNDKTTPVLLDLPQVLLFDLWSYGPQTRETAMSMRQTLWTIECQICTFFRLKIKTLCSSCSGSFVDGKCQSSRCRKDGHAVLTTNTVVLVDDGSGQAKVTFWDPGLVARLLTLSEMQWKDVVTGLSDCSELFLTKNSEVPCSPVAQLLSNLCASSFVRRPCRMTVSYTRDSQCQHSVDQMACDEFHLEKIKVARTDINSWSLPLMSLVCHAFEELL